MSQKRTPDHRQSQGNPRKPIGRPAYGSIPHMPGSNLGPGEHQISPGQVRICTERPRDRHDTIIVQEKLDGSCTAVAKHQGAILALQRHGYAADTAPYRLLNLFDTWVNQHVDLFQEILNEGERLVGEWMIQTHAIPYRIPGEQPWFAFDLMQEDQRATHAELMDRLNAVPGAPPTPAVLTTGPTPVEWVQQNLHHGHHGALDPAEGAVWRVERRGRVDFLAKWVRPDLTTGRYLPSISGQDEVWNISPAALLQQGPA